MEQCLILDFHCNIVSPNARRLVQPVVVPDEILSDLNLKKHQRTLRPSIRVAVAGLFRSSRQVG